MKDSNKFYLYKAVTAFIQRGQVYNLQTGDIVSSDEYAAIIKKNVRHAKKISITGLDETIQVTANNICVLKWDAENEYLGYEYLQSLDNYNVPDGVDYIAVNFYISLESTTQCTLEVGHIVEPHYKQLKKQFKKENGQVFFREAFDGRINLWGKDYELVKSASLEDKMLLRVFNENDVIIAISQFNKTDCKFDNFKKSVEIKPQYEDKYTKIMDAYDNTYDLIKLAPEISRLKLTKRGVVQIYIAGERVVSSYAGGTYWETEVDEIIDDEGTLLNKYHFAKGPRFIEVDLEGFNYDINTSFAGVKSSNAWNSICVTEINGVEYRNPCSIYFRKVYSKGDSIRANSRWMYTDSSYIAGAFLGYSYSGDVFRIEIWTGQNGTGTKIYESKYIYVQRNGEFELAIGERLYPMVAVSQASPQKAPMPRTFYLGDYIIEYNIWARLVCDVDKLSDGTETYDIPYDDFALPRNNYKKCIGVVGFDSPNSVIQIYQSDNKQDKPSPYGMDDFKEYFIPPYTPWRQYFYPLARNAWGNSSLWVMLNEITPDIGFEAWSSKSYKTYTLKNSYHIGDVIKAILAKIDPSVKHDKTPEYSSFLYGHSGATANALGGCDVYITQKTNILKGEYDQAAQKAEIKFKQVMDMLRECFRCYWFIDEHNRLRIEHISYFTNGLSYSSPKPYIDLTKEIDKFNRKKALYCQQETEFEKSDLPSRYEFRWMDDSTDSTGNLNVDIKNAYVQKDKTEEITPDLFSSDLDYMLFLPDDFSKDGFALILAKDGKVTIEHQYLRDEKQQGARYDVYVQNWYASWNQLIRHYMMDMPGNIISNNHVDNIYVHKVRKCMKHNISFMLGSILVNPYGLIKTDIGNGYIENISVNLDSNVAEAELRYEPE